MKKTLTLLLFTFFLSVQLKSQETDHIWSALFLTAKINPKWGVVADIQWRSQDKFQKTASLILRPGLSYQLTKSLSLSAGYAHIPTSIDSELIPEHRGWEQLIYTHKNELFGQSKVSFTHRLRLEQRWSPTGNNLYPPKHQYSNRARYFLRTLTPLYSTEVKEKTFFLSVQNEIFVNFKGKGFDQNRAYLAAGYRFHEKIDGEMGYMHLSLGNHTKRNIVQVAGYLRL